MNQAPSYQIRVLTTREEIETLREFWISCNSGRDADFDFYLFIADLFPESLRPHVVALYEGEAPKALLAGRLDVSKIPVRIGYFTLPIPRMKILQFVHGGWLGDISEVHAKLLVGSIVESLAAGEADAAFFHCPNLNSPLVRWAARLPHWLCSDHLVRPQIHRVHNFSELEGVFLASLSSAERYRVRKIEREFCCTIESFTAPADVNRFMREAEIVAKTSYQRGLGIGLSESPTVRARLEFETRMGWLRAYVLYLDRKPAAFLVGSLRSGVFLGDYMAFDPAYAQHGPGKYLVVKVMEEMYGAPRSGPGSVWRIDFGIGDAPYKEKLSNSHWYESPVYVFAPSIKGVSLNVLRSVVGFLNRSAKELMGTAPLIGTIKRTWRKRVRATVTK